MDMKSSHNETKNRNVRKNNRIPSFTLSLKKNGDQLACRLQRDPLKSMMTPLYLHRLDKPTWSDLLKTNQSLIEDADAVKDPKIFERNLRKAGILIGKVLQPVFKKFDLLKRRKGFYMALVLDRNTVKIPWELAIFSGKHQPFLCERINIGRIIDVETEIDCEDKLKRSPKDKQHLALVIGINYDGCKNPLPYCQDEARDVYGTLQKAGRHCKLNALKPLLGCENAGKETIINWFRKGLNVFHFSGHGNVRGETGLIWLNDEETLTTDEVLKALREEGTCAPILSFMNACETALQKRRQLEIYNWARAMADQGGRACIGTFWSVPPHKPSKFAETFYENFFIKKYTLGEAVRQARFSTKRLKESRNEHAIFTWPSFVLYGPPTLKTEDILI